MARKSDFTLPPIPVDAIFSTQAERDDALLERVHNIPLEEIHPFRDHPFKIQSGEEMDKMIESIRKVGAITPALARPLEDGGFELISGHRRLAACQVLGLKTMPVIVREMTGGYALRRRGSRRARNRPRYRHAYGGFGGKIHGDLPCSSRLWREPRSLRAHVGLRLRRGGGFAFVAFGHQARAFLLPLLRRTSVFQAERP